MRNHLPCVAGWFSFLGTTDVDGGAQHDEDTLAKKLADLLRTIKLKGLLLVTLACTAQVPWIIALVYIVPRVAYEVLS